MPFGGTVTIDDVESGQRAAARGGTTCHVDFCIQAQGVELQRRARRLEVEGRRQADDRHGLPHGGHRPEGGRLARGARVAARRGDHLVQALHGLQGRADGRRRDALQDDGGRRRDRRARDGARRERRRDRRARQARARRGEDGAEVPRAHPAAGNGGRGDEPRDPARTRRRRAALRRPRLLQGVGRADRARAGGRLGRLGRDLHAVLLRRLHVPRAAGLRGREVRLHAAAARQGEPGRALGRRAPRHALGDLDRPLRLPLGRPEDARPRRLLEDPERRAGPREPAAHDPPLRRRRGPDRPEPDGRAALHEPGEALRPLSAEGHDRGRLRRRHRRLRPGEAAHDHGREPGVEDGLQPLRGHRGRRRRRDRAPARPRDRRQRRGRGDAREWAASSGGRSSASSSPRPERRRRRRLSHERSSRRFRTLSGIRRASSSRRRGA